MATAKTVSAEEFVNTLGDSTLEAPGDNTKVFKDECTYCFNTPFSTGGLLISINSYCAFCPRHVKQYADATGHRLFVQVESKKVPIEKPENGGEPVNKMTKLGINVEGGFADKAFDVADEYHFVRYPQLTDRVGVVQNLGSELYKAGRYVIESVSAERLEMLQNASNAWDGEEKIVTKHKDLKQLNNGKVVPPSGWKCEADGCNLSENLWLNLTDGSIRCGRSQFISEGVTSKGNNHMKLYYEVSRFPLVVKLGTITKDGTADVYSYDEDDAVIDPNLVQHLAHFGLDPSTMQKTEKSTLELELDLNQKWEYSKCLEDGTDLKQIFGPGYTGIVNLGSTCYMNSVVQAMSVIPAFNKRFVDGADGILRALNVSEVRGDTMAQAARLFSALASGDYSVEGGENNVVKPRLFKNLIAGTHPEFRTAKQQDAEEYYRLLVDRLSDDTPVDAEDPTYALRFEYEERFEDLASHKVRYSTREDSLVQIHVPKNALKPVPNEPNRSSVSLAECLEATFAVTKLDDYRSPVTNEVKGGETTVRFKTFPEFLLLQIQKFTVDDQYQLKKLDLDLQVTDELDLSKLRSGGKQANEELLPTDAPVATAKSTAPQLSREKQDIADALVGMGFHKNACTKAAMENGNVDAALDWVMSHMDDPTINDPPVVAAAATSSAAAAAEPRQQCVTELMSFGFSEHQAKYALKQNNGDANMAAGWLFDHAAEVPPEETKPAAAPAAAAGEAKRKMVDGNGKYKLVGFISHMGSSPHSGHYVAHILKKGQWILYNDEKVAISQNPPKQLGYLYLYQRI